VTQIEITIITFLISIALARHNSAFAYLASLRNLAAEFEKNEVVKSRFELLPSNQAIIDGKMINLPSLEKAYFGLISQMEDLLQSLLFGNTDLQKVLWNATEEPNNRVTHWSAFPVKTEDVKRLLFQPKNLGNIH